MPTLLKSFLVIQFGFILALFVPVQPIWAEKPNANLAFHVLGYGEGKVSEGPSQPRESFQLEPIFLTMSEVGQGTFGVLELDGLAWYLTHWAYDNAYDAGDRPGLDHAWITVNKGLFLLNEGRGGAVDWGVGLDFDWRRYDALPRSGTGSPRRINAMGVGTVMRFKFSLGHFALISPALAYDAYARPDEHTQMLEGQGFRTDCDIWLKFWPGSLAITLQPFWHWRTFDIRLGGQDFRGARTSVLGLKMGLGNLL
jgi:hypothetical protein